MNKVKDVNRFVFLWIFIFLWSQNFFGQAVNSADSVPKIMMKVFVKKDTVLLRWAVNNKYAWKYGNQYGYLVERTTILRDGEPLLIPEKIALSNGVIKPKPQEEWELPATTNDMAAVVAQAIYGEDFEMEQEENTAIKVVNQSEEIERRFGFALYAMDRDFHVAEMAGLGFTDTSVRPNEKYLYNIRSAVPEELIKVEPAGIFISAAEPTKMPEPRDFFGYYYKDSFVLIWEYEGMLPVYGAYYLERSENNKIFQRLNEVPITKLADSDSRGISFTDSVPEYGKKFWYRIVGINNFGIEGPPSKTVELMAHKELLIAPEFTQTEVLSDREVMLQWEIPEEEQWKVKKYELLRADKPVSAYVTVVDSIPAGQKKFKYAALAAVNYFKIKAVGKNGEALISPPAMVQPVDSVPPAKPLNLHGEIDTLGIVNLRWDQNKDLDLKGYDVFKAYRKDQEFIKLNKENIQKESFLDTVDVVSNGPRVYYRIKAVDYRYNESPASDTLTLTIPDRIPPTSPVIHNYKISDDGVKISWVNSSSADRKMTVVYRKEVENKETRWMKVYESEKDTLYLDKEAISGKSYQYTAISVDASGLESAPSPPITISVPDDLVKPAIKGFYAHVDREHRLVELTWRNDEQDIAEFQLYRAVGEKPLTLYQRLKADARRFIDDRVEVGLVYKFSLRAIYTDGKMSEMEVLNVKY